MGFASLGSGSRGNATLVVFTPPAVSRTQIFMVDCGFPLKQTERRLARLGLSGGDVDAIFVTHEHADHMSGVAALAHKYALPVYASFGTAKSAPVGLRCNTFDGDTSFTVGEVSVNPVRVPHDCREPTQFVFAAGEERIGVLSDLGCVTQHVIEQYRHCTHLLLEANHDRAMLRDGAYPPRLKRRVGEDFGHLSNEQAMALLDTIAHPALHVVIGHVSEQNNSADLLEALLRPYEERVAQLQLATQQQGFDWVGAAPLVRSTLQQISLGEVLGEVL